MANTLVSPSGFVRHTIWRAWLPLFWVSSCSWRPLLSVVRQSLLVFPLHSRKTSCHAAPRMDASTGRVGPDRSWFASSRRTLAEDRARGVSRRTKAVAANSGANGSRTRSLVQACLPKSRSALAAVGTVDGPEVQVSKESFHKARRAAQERPINALLSQTKAFVEREH